ncbi:MAG: MaoC family dehydratase [Acidimicrobiia bacterium]|nr:MaoC family dehydratase [Acidimicrobiia bacterium]MDX2465720.1 MaoC family dehydratase [Acidimicrobiia bacterium]
MSAEIPVAELSSLIGTELGVTDWLQIDQDRVNAFADATLDHQFIHVDPEKAAATPFGGTIAHGFLTLSLLPFFLETASPQIEGTLMAINSGSDKVRFLQPVKVGSRVRARTTLAAADEKRPGQWLVKQAVTVDIEGEDKPALIAEMLMLYFVQ